ncbi:MAG: hypothetical protein ACJ788_00150 [Ktedonobacteraceae bacterium]
MRILATYIHPTLPIVRRVMAPFSVLNGNRGKPFHFAQQTYFQGLLSADTDALLIQNSVLAPNEFDQYCELLKEKAIIYDLTDVALVRVPMVQATLEKATAVIVPNRYLKKELEGVTRRVKVLPSMVDMNYFKQGYTAPKPTKAIVGCFGPHDWHLVKEPIRIVKERWPNITFWGDENATETLGELIDERVSIDPDRYPYIIRSCAFGLCPVEGMTPIDTIWAHEYGILCRPVIASADSAYAEGGLKKHLAGVLVPSQDQKKWVEAIHDLAITPKMRAMLGQNAFNMANEHRSTLITDQYIKAYREILPHCS